MCVCDPVLQDEKVVVSGGVALEPEWQRRGDILTAVWVGSCGEPYLGDYRSQITFNPDFQTTNMSTCRLMKARSPNLGHHDVNTHYGAGE